MNTKNVRNKSVNTQNEKKNKKTEKTATKTEEPKNKEIKGEKESDTKLTANPKTTKRTKKPKEKSTKTKEKLKIIPLGGLEEIGMNMTAFEYGDSIIVVDCGVSFPDEDVPGIDLIIPDIEYLTKNINKVKGLFITHGHEDHIGAIPYVIRDLNVPIYSTLLTMGLITNKLEQHKVDSIAKKNIVNFGDIINLGVFKVEFIKMNHSIQDSAALAIYSPVGTVIHTGDFKVDYTPVYGDPINLTRFAELGKKGVLAMLCDSTNAERSGFTMSEKSVGAMLDELFVKYKHKRILIATFASNVDRVQQIINAAYKTGRKVAIDGRSMVTIMGIAMELGYITLPKNTLVELDELYRYEPEKTVIIMTGSQGEQMASLPRIAKGKHMKIQATVNDVVILSSHPIPGNEKAVHDVINSFMMRGIEVVKQDVHVSGHACAEDIKLLYSLVKPKFSIPVHGDFMQRNAQAEIAKSLGYDNQHIKLIQSGNILALDKDSANVVGNVPTGKIMVDGNGVGNVGNIVIKERKQLATDGIVIVFMTFMENTKNMLSGPDIICRGFVYMRESRDLLQNMYKVINTTMKKFNDKKNIDLEELKEEIKMDLGDYLWDEMKSKPIILPVIMEV